MKTLPLIVSAAVLLMGTVLPSRANSPNLVPTRPARSANYWCTWYAQNYWIQRGGEITDLAAINNPNARAQLKDETVFNAKDGWASTYLPRGRSDFFFLIDHGWQTKRARERSVPGAAPFFSLQIDPRDFPRYAGLEPQEALRRFNRDIQALGWRGLGIWTRGNIPAEAARTFVQWSRYAHIQYWKIDGGDTRHFYSFQAKQAVFPDLQLEYVTGSNGPLNPHWDRAGLKAYPSVYDIGGPKQQAMLTVLQHTDTFRTYDAAPLLVSTTTMRRAHDILKQTQHHPQYRGILNLQDDPQVAAGLGCLISAKRHPNYMERTYKGKDLHHQIHGKRMIQRRMNEIERFGRWQRMAPAFAAGVGSYLASESDLIDSYPHTESDTWFKACWGKMVYQSAPAVMARNMPLPRVEVEGDAPHVMASTYPNGPVAVATEGRVRPDNQWYHPRARVTVQIGDATQLIGVFGHYGELVLAFEQGLKPVEHVWAQDLLAEQALDIRDRVSIEDRTLVVSGALIDEVGTSAGDEGDISVPGLVLKIDCEKD